MTIILIILTSLVSFVAFKENRIMNGFLLSPYRIVHKKEWYRLITHGFVHADYMHLIVNMLVFFSFGVFTQSVFESLKLQGYISNVTLHFLGLYLGGIIISSLTTVRKHRNNSLYQGVGASGGVSSVVFLSVFFQPLNKLWLMGIVPIPAIIFGVGYLIYSHYMSRKQTDNVNHDAHFIGAIFGFVYPLLISPSLFLVFLQELGL